jgi:hypothetical protein
MLFVVTAAGALAGASAITMLDRGSQQPRSVHREASPTPVSAERPGGLAVKPGTMKQVGEFQILGGTLRLQTAETTDGSECLIDTQTEENVTGSSCFPRGLFASSRVAFSVNFEGGPDRFRSLHVFGLVAPGVNAVALSKSDGSVARLELKGSRSFVFQSSVSELERDVLPTALQLFGPGGPRVGAEVIPLLR